MDKSNLEFIIRKNNVFAKCGNIQIKITKETYKLFLDGNIQMNDLFNKINYDMTRAEFVEYLAKHHLA